MRFMVLPPPPDSHPLAFSTRYVCRMRSATSLLLLVLLALPRLAWGQADARRTLTAFPLPADASVVLDGQLTEPFWSRSDSAHGFTQQEPAEGEAPSERTVVHVAYSATHLYIGARLHDSRPQGILAYQRQRDASLATDDRFMWILDTYASGRSAYFFEINPAGLRGDGLLTIGQGSDLNKNWDGIWMAEVTQDAQGWAAEIRIPFSTLNFDPEQSVWGINFQRTVRRRNEELLWTGYPRDEGLFRPQNAGRLVGLEGVSQGLGLELTPYGLTKADRTWTNGSLDTDPVYDAGFDLSYSLTTNLRAAITVNTDFAETEVDDRRVNLTRFPLQFPEKRDFFLEGSGVYQFAPRSNVDPYFSRRIGLVQGTQVPILGGARLNGQIGRYEVGFQQLRTGRDSDVPAEDFTVARVRANILSESTVGAIYTRRYTHDRPTLQARHTAGFDLELGTSTFRGNQNLQFQAFFVAHNAPTPDDATSFFDRTTRGIRLSYPNQPWSGHVSYREFGDAFDPAVGFNARDGFRRLQPSVGYSIQVARSPLLREIVFEYRHEFLADLGLGLGDLFAAPATVRNELTVNNELTFLEVEFESGEALASAVGHTVEWLPTVFDIRRDGSILIPPGRYPLWNWEVEAASAPFRLVSGEGTFEYREFWTGTRTDYGLELTLRPGPGLRFTGLWQHNDVNLAEGRFRTNLVRATAGIDPTPALSLTANLQYDNLTEVLGLYTRLRWILQPGSDLFLVYTHNWLDDPAATTSRFRPLSSEATLKLTYSYRF